MHEYKPNENILNKKNELKGFCNFIHLFNNVTIANLTETKLLISIVGFNR